MATRSRKGCIDCKQAKIKCDELHPHCGTCTRRRRVCSGYTRNSSRTTPSTTGDAGINRAASAVSNVSMPPSQLTEAHSMTATRDYMRSIILEASTKAIPPSRGPSFIPVSEVLAADKLLIEVYFMRHPSDMIINNDVFVEEMNSAAIALLQQSPTAVGDALAAIGENYVADSLMNYALVSTRKTRLLTRLRLINEEDSSPELVLMLLLALCGVELVDPRSDGDATTLSALIGNVSIVLAVYSFQSKQLSALSKYFARAVARQDLVISLTRMQRTRIEPYAWLDEYSTCHADRVLGLTTTLVPLLSKLAALAEDVKFILGHHTSSSGEKALGGVTCHDIIRRSDLLEREAYLRAELLSWRLIRDHSLSRDMSRALLFHAYAWRAAALLYLFRLFHRPGSSAEADAEALSMAYEVMIHISGSPQDIKLTLWPLFIAACELEAPEDRDHATRLFDDICHTRPIATTRRTRAFVVGTIWPARDSRSNWDWMRDSQCAPIPL